MLFVKSRIVQQPKMSKKKKQKTVISKSVAFVQKYFPTDLIEIVIYGSSRPELFFKKVFLEI